MHIKKRLAEMEQQPAGDGVAALKTMLPNCQLEVDFLGRRTARFDRYDGTVSLDELTFTYAHMRDADAGGKLGNAIHKLWDDSDDLCKKNTFVMARAINCIFDFNPGYETGHNYPRAFLPTRSRRPGAAWYERGCLARVASRLSKVLVQPRNDVPPMPKGLKDT